jgi:hypothetical protein
MSTKTASANTLFRLGGIAAILGILFTLGYAVVPLLLGIGALVMAVYYFALYRGELSMLNLAATLSAAGGAILLLFIKIGPSQIYGIALAAAIFVPALLAGLAANGRAGFPRALAIAGILGGVFGLLNYVVVAIGGGDYTNPNSPALTPFIWATYIPAMLATLVWLVWGGIHLFRKA